MVKRKRVAIIGAGPAGLTAAYLLCKAGEEVVVFEKDARYVGGISRTEAYKGYLFDIGGHRFFSKSAKVEAFWSEILGPELLERPRSSRIYYNNKFFSYPLSPFEALRKLGIKESFLCICSYLYASLFPVKNPQNFEDWVSNHFGKRLYRIFFKTYTEKVWGTSCKEISADWAAQRIKGLSLFKAVSSSIFKNVNSSNKHTIKTLIESFRYPRLGPGMMWEACSAKVEEMGGVIKMAQDVKGIQFNNEEWTVILKNQNDEPGFDYVISSAAIRDLIPGIYPSVDEAVKSAANKLQYRDFLTVVLILKDKKVFEDNWIYIHDPKVNVGRVQNFKSWSPDMVPDDTMVCYGMEYFCFEGDSLWEKSDKELVALASKELEIIKLGVAGDVVDGYVVRQPKAYPVYDPGYKANVDLIREALKSYKGLYLVGRNGMHKYNNQDHSMMTAMLAVENIIAGAELYDLWKVNGDAIYLETDDGREDNTGRLVPKASNNN